MYFLRGNYGKETDMKEKKTGNAVIFPMILSGLRLRIRGITYYAGCEGLFLWRERCIFVCSIK